MKETVHWRGQTGMNHVRVRTHVNNEQNDNAFTTVTIEAESGYHPGHKHSTYIPRECLPELIRALEGLKMTDNKIDKNDIRVGDKIERREVITVNYVDDWTIGGKDDAGVTWNLGKERGESFLVERPDPKKAVRTAMANAIN